MRVVQEALVGGDVGIAVKLLGEWGRGKRRKGGSGRGLIRGRGGVEGNKWEWQGGAS